MGHAHYWYRNVDDVRRLLKSGETLLYLCGLGAVVCRQLYRFLRAHLILYRLSTSH